MLNAPTRKHAYPKPNTLMFAELCVRTYARIKYEFTNKVVLIMFRLEYRMRSDGA